MIFGKRKELTRQVTSLQGENQHLQEQMRESEQGKKSAELQLMVLKNVLDLLGETGVFLVEDIQAGTIIYSNESGKKLVLSMTGKRVIDGKTSIHEFHKTPERSKTVLNGLKPGEMHENTTLEIGKNGAKMIIKSSSHSMEVDGKKYYVGLMEDGTQERAEIERLFIIQEQIFFLFRSLANDSNSGVDCLITRETFGEARKYIGEQKDDIDQAFHTAMERFKTDLSIFQKVMVSSKELSDIFEQLNLLALNGAIEAARVGESGRGFAVVADATRATATKCNEIARGNIAELTQQIEQGTGEIQSVSTRLQNIMDKTDIITRIDSNIILIDEIIVELRAALQGKITEQAKMIKLLKDFYREKLTGKERASALLSMSKFDHLLFIIKLNSQIIDYDKNMAFSNHEACDLGKFIHSPEFIVSLRDGKQNKVYSKLLQSHKGVHELAARLHEDITKYKNNTDVSTHKDQLIAIAHDIKTELSTQVNTVLQLIDGLKDEIL